MRIGTRSAAFLMVGEDESYDLAHFEFIMRAYRAARPPHAEGLAVWIAGHLAHRS